MLFDDYNDLDVSLPNHTKSDSLSPPILFDEIDNLVQPLTSPTEYSGGFNPFALPPSEYSDPSTRFTKTEADKQRKPAPEQFLIEDRKANSPGPSNHRQIFQGFSPLSSISESMKECLEEIESRIEFDESMGCKSIRKELDNSSDSTSNECPGVFENLIHSYSASSSTNSTPSLFTQCQNAFYDLSSAKNNCDSPKSLKSERTYTISESSSSSKKSFLKEFEFNFKDDFKADETVDDYSFKKCNSLKSTKSGRTYTNSASSSPKLFLEEFETNDIKADEQCISKPKQVANLKPDKNVKKRKRINILKSRKSKKRKAKVSQTPRISGLSKFFNENKANEEIIRKYEAKVDSCNFAEETQNLSDNPSGDSVLKPNLEYLEAKLSKLRVLPKREEWFQMFYDDNAEVVEEKNNAADLDEARCISPDIFENYTEEPFDSGIKTDSGNIVASFSRLQEKLSFNSVEEGNGIAKSSSKGNFDLIKTIENIIQDCCRKVISGEPIEFEIRNSAYNENCILTDDILTLKSTESSKLKRVIISNRNSKHRLCVILFLLSQIYHFLLTGTTCTIRELYYRDPDFFKNQTNVTAGIRDICCLLNASPWELGIFSTSKGLIAGPLKLTLADGGVIDCLSNRGGIQLPHDTTGITKVETTARYVLIVEKDTVYEKLIKQDIFRILGLNVILITGKGFPDINTRVIIKKISSELKIPIFGLFDADPFGIEIYLVYRYGSRAMSFSADELACPEIKWIGIHPSEIELFAIPSVPLNKEDTKRLTDLLKRSYIDQEIRRELQVFNSNKRKAEIESFSNFSEIYLLAEYLPNKIREYLF